jgi:hypothetical protein
MSKNKIVKQKRIFTNVNAEGLRGPTASGLNDVGADTQVSEHGGATGS